MNQLNHRSDLRKVVVRLFALLVFVPTVQETFAQNITALFQQSQSYEQDGDHNSALIVMRQAAGLAPNHDSILAYAGHVAYQAGQFDEGAAYARRGVQCNDRSPVNYVVLAENARGQQDVKLTRDACLMALSFGPQRLGQENFVGAKAILNGVRDRERLVTWTFDPRRGVAQDGYYLIALPSTQLPYQKGNFEVKGAEEFRRVQVGDNDALLVKSDGVNPFQIHCRLRCSAASYRLAHVRERGATPDEVGPYLRATEGVDPTSALVSSIASKLRAADKVSTVRNIQAWMKGNIQYQLVFPGSADGVIRQGAGDCGGKAMVFTALCRHCGIPARQVWGIVDRPMDVSPTTLAINQWLAQQGASAALLANSNTLCSHVWAEIYLAGRGWIPVDPALVETLGMLPTNYVRIAHYEADEEKWAACKQMIYNTAVMPGPIVPFQESKD